LNLNDILDWEQVVFFFFFMIAGIVGL